MKVLNDNLDIWNHPGALDGRVLDVYKVHACTRHTITSSPATASTSRFPHWCASILGVIGQEPTSFSPLPSLGGIVQRLVCRAGEFYEGHNNFLPRCNARAYVLVRLKSGAQSVLQSCLPTIHFPLNNAKYWIAGKWMLFILPCVTPLVSP